MLRIDYEADSVSFAQASVNKYGAKCGNTLEDGIAELTSEGPHNPNRRRYQYRSHDNQ